MKQNLNYFQTIANIDLRNGKFQGSVNNKQQRDGFGILMEDNLTLYFSEWVCDQLNGETLIIRMDGTILYGQCKSNNLNNAILFKNSEYTILSQFKEGNPINYSAAFDKNMANTLIFNTNVITNKKVTEKPFYNRFIPIQEIRKQKEIIQKIAQENQIQIGKFEIEFLQFLRSCYKKYEQRLVFLKKQAGGYYFGFKNGLGFQFTLSGNVHQKIQVLSMGVYGKLRLLQIGVKHHRNRCFQQGRFNIKQTITYGNLLQRPQKCKQMHQNLHKQSLNFISKYFYLKDNFLGIFEDFIYKKLQKEFHEAVTLSHQRKKSKITQKSPKKQGFIVHSKNHKTVAKNQSFTNLTSRKNKLGRNRSVTNKSHINGKQAKNDESDQQVVKSQLKMTSCVKNRSRIDSKSKSKSKKQLFINNYQNIRQNSLKNYEINKINHSKQNINENISHKNLSPSPSKNNSSLTKVTKVQNTVQNIVNNQKQPDKSITRINEQKIRQQLYMNELNENYHLIQRTPFKVVNQLCHQNYRREQTHSNINKAIMSSKSQKNMQIQKQILGTDFMRHFQDIQRRRMKLLSDFKNLNSNSPHQRLIDHLTLSKNQNIEIQEFNLIQPPFTHKGNKDLDQHYPDRFKGRYRNLQNKAKISGQNSK